MPAKGLIFGHPVYWDDEHEIYRWTDNDEPAYHWGGQPRPCSQCRQLPTPEGYDPCIGHLPGAYSVCCGHGRENGFIGWEANRRTNTDMATRYNRLVFGLIDLLGEMAAWEPGHDQESEQT